MEVGFINELNRLLSDVKDKEAMYEIVENSNLMQALSEEKKKKFFELNEKLKKPENDWNGLWSGLMPNWKEERLKAGDKSLKLNLEGLPKNA